MTPDERLDQLCHVLMAFARAEFDTRATLTDGDDALDALAVGLNMLGEELQATHGALQNEIHERALAEERVRKLNAELERRVEERTRQLKALKLQRQVSQHMATVGTMAAGIAHEINNPLMAVMGNLEHVTTALSEMADGPAPEGVQELSAAVRDAHEAAARINKIVTRMKGFSRADEHRPTVVEVRRVLDAALKMTGNEVRHRAKLVTERSPTPLVNVDEARLCQVFVNLIVNAAQAMGDNSAGTNEIRISTKTSATGQAVIEVRDNGPGIPAAVRSRIFDPFFSTQPVGQGAGLGLSICERLVTAMGGALACEDAPAGGTLFRVTLPPTAASPAACVPEAGDVGESDGQAARILVVDDEAVVRVTVSRMLSRKHEVKAVASAAEALQLLQSGERIDVIICDVMMPEMSGIELYKKLAQASPKHVGRLVFITGGSFMPSARHFLERVPNPCLGKPCKAGELRRVVQAVLSH